MANMVIIALLGPVDWQYYDFCNVILAWTTYLEVKSTTYIHYTAGYKLKNSKKLNETFNKSHACPSKTEISWNYQEGKCEQNV